MKKFLAIFLAVVMVLGLAACGGPKEPGPEETVTAFMEGMKAFDLEAMQACTQEQFSEDNFFTDETEEFPELFDYMKSNAAKIEYKIAGTDVTGDSAKVTVSTDYVDTSEVLKETFVEYFNLLFTVLGTEATEEEYEDSLKNILADKIANVPAGTITEDIVFTLSKKDSGWKITELPDQAAVAMSGNLEAGLEAAGEHFSSMFEDAGWTSAEEPVEYPISNEVVLDNDSVRVTILSGGKDEWGYISFPMLIENKLSDANVTVSIYHGTINGWLTDFFMSETVNAGESLEANLELFSSNVMEVFGLEAPDKMELEIKAYKEDDWFLDDIPYLANEWVTVYPTGLSEAEIVIPERPAGSNEMTVVDADGLTFTIIGETDDPFYSYSLQTYISNDSGNELSFMTEDFAINGDMYECYFGTSVPNGKEAIQSIGVDFYDDDGHTQNYKHGEYAATRISVKAGDRKIIAFRKEGSYAGTVERINLKLISKEKGAYWVSVAGKPLTRYIVSDGFEAADEGWFYNMSERSIQVKCRKPEKDEFDIVVSTEKFDLIGMADE